MKHPFFCMFLACVAATLVASPAFACSMRLTSEQAAETIEDHYRSAFAFADAVVEFEAISDISASGGGTARILRVFKGGLETGSNIEFPRQPNMVESTCSPPRIQAGTRGIFVLRPGQDRFEGA